MYFQVDSIYCRVVVFLFAVSFMVLFQFPAQALAKRQYTIHLTSGATITTSKYYRDGDFIIYSKYRSEIRVSKSAILRITDEKLNEIDIAGPDTNLSDKQDPVAISDPEGQRKVGQGGDDKVEACRKKLMQYDLLSRRTCDRCEKMKELRMEIYSDKNSTPSDKLKADQEYKKACDGCRRYQDRFEHYKNQCGG